jgi:hypothetical protein
MYAFAKSLRKAEHVRRYSIQPTATGWELREEQDSRVVRQRSYRDWHRVEHARRVLAQELSHLRDEGWQEVQ